MQLLIWRSFLKRSNSKKEVVSRRGLVWEEWRWGDIVQKVQTFSYELNKVWGSNVEQGEYKNSVLHSWGLLKVPRKMNLSAISVKIPAVRGVGQVSSTYRLTAKVRLALSECITTCNPPTTYMCILHHLLVWGWLLSCKFLSTGSKISWS